MHGVKKSDITPQKREQMKENIDKYKQLNELVLAKKKNKVYDKEVLTQCGKILTINSEHYTIWNYRREILLHLFKIEPKTKPDLIIEELKIIERALHRNPKSYCAFSHRQWCVENDLNNDIIDLKSELLLCTTFLSFDARNFHCWDYRRYIVSKGEISLKKELEYTKKLIGENFSNYSAWHYRSTLVPKIYKKKPDALIKKIKNELKFARDAFWTEPDDQSAWLYHRWLLGKDGFATMLRISKTSKKYFDQQCVGFHELTLKMLKDEFAMCEDFLKEEPNSKWALLTSAVLIRALDARGEPIENQKERCNEIFEKLVSIDTDRKNYYLDVKDTLLSQFK